MGHAVQKDVVQGSGIDGGCLVSKAQEPGDGANAQTAYGCPITAVTVATACVHPKTGLSAARKPT